MPGRRPPQRVISERRRRIYSEVLSGLSVAQISSKHKISKRTVGRDLAALRKSLGPEYAKKLRRIIIANVSPVFTPKKAREFISLCQKIIRGEASLLSKQVLPRFSKTNANGARKIVHLLRTTSKSFRQIAKETSAHKNTVGLAYQGLVARGEKIVLRGKGVQISKKIVAKNGISDPETKINVLEKMAQKAGLTLQEKAVVYCKLVGMQQQEMAKIIGVRNLEIIRVLKYVRKEMNKVPAAKP